MKLLPLLLAITFLDIVDSRFVCPDGLPCYCYSRRTGDSYINCVTGISIPSSFDVKIKTAKLVRIHCQNSPDWSDFLLGWTINVGPVKQFVFNDCAPPGAEDAGYIIQQMNVSDVEYLRYEDIKAKLTPEDLDAFPAVQNLVLLNNDLWDIDSRLLRGLVNLKQLEIRSSQIQISGGLFDRASALKALELSNSHLDALKPGVFNGLKNIELLNLWKNNLTVLHPKLFCNLSTLLTLDIHQNNLSTLPVEIFADLKNLKIINFGSNNISSLPEHLFKHNPDLKIVKMLFNRGNLTSLPNGLLANLTNLQIVSLMHGRLTSLPENLLWGSTGLLDLNINQNHLAKLPGSLLKDTVELHSLSLAFNELTELPDGIFENTRKMIKLDLSRNHLKSINAGTLVGLQSLQELTMESNELEIIDFGAFSTLVELKIAKFSNNKLSFQSYTSDFGASTVSPFWPCDALEELYLSYNNISKMYTDWILSKNHLRKLDLSYNSFKQIETMDLRLTSQNTNVDLSHNSITKISLARLQRAAKFLDSSGLPKYFRSCNVTIRLDANPIKCDCSLYPFLRFINGELLPEYRNFSLLDLEKLSCASPKYLEDTKLINLEPSTFMCRVENNDSTIPNDPCSAVDGECDCWHRPADNTLILDCAERNLIKAPLLINVTGIDNVELDLSMNRLKKAPNMTHNGYEKVKSLNLSGNNIGIIDESLITPNLRYLNLDGNNLTSIDTRILLKILNASQIIELTLRNNHWPCDCSSRDLLLFIKSNFRKIPDFVNINCGSSKVPFLALSVSELCPVLFEIIIIYGAIFSSLAVVVGLITTSLYFRFRNRSSLNNVK